ncbi:MAG: hypothetical protein ACOZIN_22080 [Myxococcota bacterium]
MQLLAPLGMTKSSPSMAVNVPNRFTSPVARTAASGAIQGGILVQHLHLGRPHHLLHGGAHLIPVSPLPLS